MNYQLKNLDFWGDEIKKASSDYLKSILKNGLCSNVQIEDMIEKELYVREQST